MPTGDANLKAVQIVTQRVSVEPASKRSGAEPIGRDFADLVDAARADAEPAGDTPEKTSSSDNLLVSNLVEEADSTTPAAFLVANATLADAAQPVAGVLRHPDEPAIVPAETAPTDILVDTAGLFLPLDPNRPIQTNASTHSTQFDALSWPPPESPAGLQAAASNASNQPIAQPLATNHTNNLAPAVEDVLPIPEAGPAANRQSAKLMGAVAEGESALTQAGGNTQSSGASSPTAQPAASAASAQQVASALPASIETTQPATPQPATPASTTPAGPVGATMAQATSATASQSAAPQAGLATAPSATIQIYNRIVERFDGRAQQFQIRLDPPELGRVNVRIEISSDNRVHAVLATHDSNALADLLRGQRALEQSLANAGLDLADEGITFELSDQNTHQSAGRDDPSGGRQGDRDSAPLAEAVDAASDPTPPPWSRGRINLVA